MIKKMLCKLFGKKEGKVLAGPFISEAVQEFSSNVIPSETLGIKPLDKKLPPRKILPDVFPNIPWKIGGGWGYVQEDAVVINADNSFDGIQMENAFLQCRTYLEAFFSMPQEHRFAGFEFEKIKQSLCNDKKGKRYDLIIMKVTAFKESDYTFLKNDWESHNAYEGDEIGMQNHLSLRDSKLIEYEITGWFDISNFFGK